MKVREVARLGSEEEAWTVKAGAGDEGEVSREGTGYLQRTQSESEGSSKQQISSAGVQGIGGKGIGVGRYRYNRQRGLLASERGGGQRYGR